MQTTMASLNTLPYELRAQIYSEYLFATLEENPRTNVFKLSLMRTNRQLNREVADARHPNLLCMVVGY